MVATTFLLVLAGHLIGDWVVQTDWQAANKPSSWRACLMHVTTYHLTMVVLLIPVWDTQRTPLLLTVSYATHAFIDRRWPVIMLMRVTGSPAFAEQMWGVIAVDQALHLSILALLTAALT